MKVDWGRGERRMIKIMVELVSANGPDRDKLLGVGLISNIGGDDHYGDYSIWLSKMEPRTREAWKHGAGKLTAEDYAHFFDTEVKHFDREERGCWDLIYLALRQLVADRNPDLPAPTTQQPVMIPRLQRKRRT